MHIVMNRPVSPKIIAVCGKGGVGKTSVSALITKLLCPDRQKKILAIDADPGRGLSFSLGVHSQKTVDTIRNELITRIKKGEQNLKEDLLSFLDYEIFNAIIERDNLAFLAIGRPESAGCYCRVNSLLKEIIAGIAGNFDFIVIDGEAGIEQVHRRVMERVTHLLLVSDVSARGIHVAQDILKVSKHTIAFEKSGLLLNRVRPDETISKLHIPETLERIGTVPEDTAIREFDIEGKSLLHLPQTPSLIALERVLKNFLG